MCVRLIPFRILALCSEHVWFVAVYQCFLELHPIVLRNSVDSDYNTDFQIEI